jgi:tRNA(adenine34) deaminase
MNMFSSRDEHWMRQAIRLAGQAEKVGEVPVGAVLVLNDELVAEGYNQPIATHDATAHAEIMALRAAGQSLNNYRLLNTTLYVTLEPCMMCAGALVHARIGRVVFGAHDLRAGAVVTQDKVFDKPFLNHQVAYEGGLLGGDCARLMQAFFKAKR